MHAEHDQELRMLEELRDECKSQQRIKNAIIFCFKNNKNVKIVLNP